jgi:hypothetical protein
MEEDLVTLIKYDGSAVEWKNKIQRKIEEILDNKATVAGSKQYIYGIAFVNALLTPELEAILKLPYHWQKKK